MAKKSPKLRLVEILLTQGLARDHKHAQGLILSGEVLVDERPVTQVGAEVSLESQIRLRTQAQKYVSRGGDKLEAALKHFKVQVAEKICLDLGASTGGFTDCLLQHQAKKVYAVDVGYGQLAETLRQDSRVVILDRTHVRELNSELVPEKVELVVMDLSFISISVSGILAQLSSLLTPRAQLIILIKPQFELPAELIPEGGVVTDPRLHIQACSAVVAAAEKLGWKTSGLIPSPILGAKGNREFLALFAISLRENA